MAEQRWRPSWAGHAVAVEPVRPHALDHAAAGPLLSPDVVDVEVAATTQQLDRHVAGRKLGAGRDRRGHAAAPTGCAASCSAHMLAYRPPAATSSAWLPRSATRPPSSTRIWSASRTVRRS